MAKVKQHIPGEVRYFTYHLMFPDGDHWVGQTPFVHDLQFQLDQTAWRNDVTKKRDLLQKGETHWRDNNGVQHRVVIESVCRPTNWGVKRKGRL